MLYFAGASKKSNAFISFFALLTIHNASELLLFFHYFTGSDAFFSMQIYYACSFGVLAGLLIYAIDISGFRFFPKVTNQIIVFIFLSLSFLTIFTPLIISGYQDIAYAVTAKKGEYYFIFRIVSLSTFLFVLCILLAGCLFRPLQNKAKCAYTILSLCPVLLIGTVVIFLMKSGVQVNAMSVLPIGTTLIVLITLFGEKRHKTTDVRQWLPWSKEFKLAREMLNLIQGYSQRDLSLKQVCDMFQKMLIVYDLEKSKGDAIKVVESTGASKSTLYSKMAKFGINANVYKNRD